MCTDCPARPAPASLRVPAAAESALNRPFAPLLASVALTICAANAAHAQSAMPDRRLCRGDAYIVGYRSDLPRDGERDTAVTELTAKALSAVREGDYELTGEPEIRRADQRLAADRIHYQSVQDIAVAEGNVQYQDRSMAVGAATANVDLGRDITTLTGARYQLIGENTDGKLSRGNGLASEVRASGAQGKQLATLKDVTYSTCDPGQRDWEITARTMDLDQASGKGTARGMRLRFKDVPILALPYATFPIDDRRRSGLLLPSIGGTNVNGFDFLIPYSLNLAPNYDATLTPRLIGGRGFMAGSEFRWLGAAQHGQFSASYLPNDRDADRNRYSYTFKHSASLSPNFFVVSDINRVSDPRYFEDFGDSLAASATSLLPSSAYLHGRGSWWSMSFGGDDIEVTDPPRGRRSRTLPTSAALHARRRVSTRAEPAHRCAQRSGVL